MEKCQHLTLIQWQGFVYLDEFVVKIPYHPIGFPQSFDQTTRIAKTIIIVYQQTKAPMPEVYNDGWLRLLLI